MYTWSPKYSTVGPANLVKCVNCSMLPCKGVRWIGTLQTMSADRLHLTLTNSGKCMRSTIGGNWHWWWWFHCILLYRAQWNAMLVGELQNLSMYLHVDFSFLQFRNFFPHGGAQLFVDKTERPVEKHDWAPLCRRSATLAVKISGNSVLTLPATYRPRYLSVDSNCGHPPLPPRKYTFIGITPL